MLENQLASQLVKTHQQRKADAAAAEPSSTPNPEVEKLMQPTAAPASYGPSGATVQRSSFSSAKRAEPSKPTASVSSTAGNGAIPLSTMSPVDVHEVSDSHGLGASSFKAVRPERNGNHGFTNVCQSPAMEHSLSGNRSTPSSNEQNKVSANLRVPSDFCFECGKPANKSMSLHEGSDDSKGQWYCGECWYSWYGLNENGDPEELDHYADELHQMQQKIESSVEKSEESSSFNQEYDGEALPLPLAKLDDPSSGLAELQGEDLQATLNQARNLGAALDLVGAYLKNYEVDKADAVLSRVLPLCRQRGGVWLVKGLNWYVLLKGKEGLHQEQLDALQELESLVPFDENEHLGWQFYDIMYRNFGCSLRALGRVDEALEYSWKSVRCKQKAGEDPTWFDLWDIGKAHAHYAQIDGNRAELLKGYRLIEKAAEIHRKAEPNCTIIIAKILDSAGQCCIGLGDTCQGSEQMQWYKDADRWMKEAYEIFCTCCGPKKPLVGWMAGTRAFALERLRDWKGAREMLHHAFRVEAYKDIITVPGIADLLDRLFMVHWKQEDWQGMREYEEDLNMALDNLRSRCVRQLDGAAFANLLQKIADVLLASDDGSFANFPCAVDLIKEAKEIILEQPGSRKMLTDRIDAKLASLEEVVQLYDGNKDSKYGVAGKKIMDEARWGGPPPREISYLALTQGEFSQEDLDGLLKGNVRLTGIPPEIEAAASQGRIWDGELDTSRLRTPQEHGGDDRKGENKGKGKANRGKGNGAEKTQEEKGKNKGNKGTPHDVYRSGYPLRPGTDMGEQVD
eukprot:gnl/MRDRNA2_/MRDRNA2_34585_c0_seq1.p1 gnl/MRDRNA2_/MRDRNA2_34585_c0~~gnl/MRDRNA2_/MRDRNA2_34585_c0_seq1.p1  ORF type:complete len:843 (+),score=179.36 gnl/MRDRNA2_/MRDRNA2_34585_c0_seq1:146-2530(+)